METSGFYVLAKGSLVFFAYTMVELALLFVGISFLVGVINEFMPQEKVKKWLSGRNGRGYLLGSLLGGLTPFCSCSTIPVMVGLLRAKAGFGPTMAFLFTSPLVNPIIIALFLSLIGAEVTLVYALVAIGMSISISFMLEQLGFEKYVKQDVLQNSVVGGSISSESGLAETSEPYCGEPLQPVQPLPVVQMQSATQCCAPSTSGPSSEQPISLVPFPPVDQTRWRRIFDDAVNQFRKLLPFIVLGVAIGSIIHGFLPADLVVKLAGEDNPLAIPVSAVVGIPLYLRVSTMIPIAASLIAKGMSIGAVIALIIGGAGASLPEVAMLKGLFRAPLLLAFILSVLIMAVVAGFSVNFFYL